MSKDADLAIGILSDMLRRPTFPVDEFTKERDRAIDSIKADKDSDARVLIGTYAAAFLFNNHSYGRPSGGSEKSLAKLTRNDIQNFYRDQFGGDRLILAVVGDFNSQQMEAKLRRAFGDWGKSASPAPKTGPPAPSQGRRVLLVDKPDATQTYFWIGNVGVSRTDKELATVDLANTVFGGRFTSLLNTALRIESGLSYGARSAMLRLAQPGSVGITSYTRTEDTGKAVDLALDVLTKYQKDAMNAQTLASAKSYVLGQFLRTSRPCAARRSDRRDRVVRSGPQRRGSLRHGHQRRHRSGHPPDHHPGLSRSEKSDVRLHRQRRRNPGDREKVRSGNGDEDQRPTIRAVGGRGQGPGARGQGPGAREILNHALCTGAQRAPTLSRGMGTKVTHTHVHVAARSARRHSRGGWARR